MINHHLPERILLAYSAGTLPEAFNLVVATHVSLCDECRATLDAMDCVGGAVLSSAESNDISVDLDATLRKIESGFAEDRQIRRPGEAGVFPLTLQDYVGGDLDSVKWKPIGMGVRQSILSTSKDATVRLLHIPAGAAVPDHGHRGVEMTVVLKGAFRDEVDRFARGDIEVADEHLHHTPVAEEGEDCICLAATDAPLKFRSFVPRVVQSFLRI